MHPGDPTLLICCDHARRVSVVGVAAEVFVCRRMSGETGGTYGVALNEVSVSGSACSLLDIPVLPLKMRKDSMGECYHQ
jgi:hypothetical protein